MFASWQSAITLNIDPVLQIILVMSIKRNRQGLFTATIKPQTLQETDTLRGDLPRSRWIERALKMYNASVKEGKENSANNNNNGVRGSESSNQVPTSAPTPTSTEARKTNMPLYNGGLGA